MDAPHGDRNGPPEDLPKVTAAHLRRADDLCPRRLACERAGRRGQGGAAARFAVVNRLAADARQAHAGRRAPSPADFPVPADLFPEQQRVYAAAAAGYLACFPAPARAAGPAEVDEWETEVPALGVRLVGGAGLPVEVGADGDADDAREVRLLLAGDRGFGRPLLDDVDVRVAVLRAGAWAGPRLRVVAADLLGGVAEAVEVDVPAARPAAEEWLAARDRVIRRAVEAPVARPGFDCLGCAHVAGCAAHREEAARG